MCAAQRSPFKKVSDGQEPAHSRFVKPCTPMQGYNHLEERRGVLSSKFIRQDKGCLLLILTKAPYRLSRGPDCRKNRVRKCSRSFKGARFQPWLSKNKRSELMFKAPSALPLSIDPQLRPALLVICPSSDITCLLSFYALVRLFPPTIKLLTGNYTVVGTFRHLLSQN